MLTKGQREAVSDFLVALTSQMQPAMLLKLLRKLTVDVSKLSEYTTVALRVCIIAFYYRIALSIETFQLLTLHYERCAKYYGTTSGQSIYGTSSDEEKRLTMMLFSNIFDSLSKMDYDPELFGKALPCLTAIGRFSFLIFYDNFYSNLICTFMFRMRVTTRLFSVEELRR
jgi:ryanodine receptor 2